MKVLCVFKDGKHSPIIIEDAVCERHSNLYGIGFLEFKNGQIFIDKKEYFVGQQVTFGNIIIEIEYYCHHQQDLGGNMPHFLSDL